MKKFILTICLVLALLAPCFAFDVYNFIGKDVTISMRYPATIDCHIITILSIPRCLDHDQYGNCLREVFYEFVYVKKSDGSCMFIGMEDIDNITERHG
jgi:hypothetical protein